MHTVSNEGEGCAFDFGDGQEDISTTSIDLLDNMLYMWNIKQLCPLECPE